MPTPATLREIRRATRHHGVATHETLNLTQHQLDSCCANDVLARPHRGVYIDRAAPRTPLQDLAVAVAAGGRLAAAWGRSAACLWCLLDEHPPTPEIVIPWQYRKRIHGVTVHRSRALCAEMLLYRYHIRVTNPLVTALDLGVVLSPVEVGDVIIRARQMKLFEPTAVRTTISKYAKPGRTGLVTARAAVDLIMIGDRPADSVLEFRFHIGPRRHGLPPYSYQHEVRVGDRKFFIDFAYPEVMLAIEVDGYEKRASRESLDKDAQRGVMLTLAGWTVVHFTWTRIVNDPAGVAADILTLLGNRGYRFGR
ncbi:MAG: hypothetical protein QOH79_1458 [Acidimicrobiaceae bacterium]